MDFKLSIKDKPDGIPFLNLPFVEQSDKSQQGKGAGGLDFTGYFAMDIIEEQIKEFVTFYEAQTFHISLNKLKGSQYLGKKDFKKLPGYKKL